MSTCDHANRDGWSGFYSGGVLNVTLHGRANAHPIIADYGLDRSGLWNRINPDAYASAWCAVQGQEPSNWGARAYVLSPQSKCFAPANKAACPEWCARWTCNGAEWCNGKSVVPEPCNVCRDGPPWSSPSKPHRLAHDFAQFRPMGSTIRFTVDLHRVGCGAVLTAYLSGLPAVDSSFQFYEQQAEDKARSIPGCGGQMYYADANPEMTGCSSYGFEFDLFEGNVDSMHSTAHGCVSGLDVPGSVVKSGFVPGANAVGSSGWYGRIDRSSSYPDPNVKLMHNQICDGDGVGIGISGTGVKSLGNRSYGWGEAFTINTQHPFEVAIRFDDHDSADSWSYTTTLTQGGRSLWRTTRKSDAVTEQSVFPRAGAYTVKHVEAQEKSWIVVDGQYLPRVAAATSQPVHHLFFAADGTTVDVSRQLRLGDTIELGGAVFSNNVTSTTAMPTSRRQHAWGELGVSLRSKGLAMVLAYWAQGSTSSYKELGKWDTFWLNGECKRATDASYPWQEKMGFGCISHIRIERNPDGSTPPANIHGQEAFDSSGSGWSAEEGALPTVTDLALVSIAALGVLLCWRHRRDGLLWMRNCLRRHTSLALLPQQDEPIEPSAQEADTDGKAVVAAEQPSIAIDPQHSAGPG